MSLDSVRITLTSLSLYKSNKLSSSLGLLPILLFFWCILFRSMYLWNHSVFMPFQGQKIDRLTDSTERGKQTKSSLVLEKEEGKSDCSLIKNKANNKLHQKQHADVSTVHNIFYFGPAYAEQWSGFHEPLPHAFHTALEQRSFFPILLQAPSNSKGREPFSIYTRRQSQQTLTYIWNSQCKHLLQLTDHTKF